MHFQFIGPAQSVIQKAIGYVRSIVAGSEREGVDFECSRLDLNAAVLSVDRPTPRGGRRPRGGIDMHIGMIDQPTPRGGAAAEGGC